jgi:hypothetical protein
MSTNPFRMLIQTGRFHLFYEVLCCKNRRIVFIIDLTKINARSFTALISYEIETSCCTVWSAEKLYMKLDEVHSADAL